MRKICEQASKRESELKAKSKRNLLKKQKQNKRTFRNHFETEHSAHGLSKTDRPLKQEVNIEVYEQK